MWYSWVTEDGTRRLKHGLEKQLQYCVRVIALWSQSGAFSHRKLLVYNLIFSYPHVWSCIMGNDCKNAILSAKSRDWIFGNNSQCDTSRQISELWNSQSTVFPITFPKRRADLPCLLWFGHMSRKGYLIKSFKKKKRKKEFRMNMSWLLFNISNLCKKKMTRIALVQLQLFQMNPAL